MTPELLWLWYYESVTWFMSFELINTILNWLIKLYSKYLILLKEGTKQSRAIHTVGWVGVTKIVIIKWNRWIIDIKMTWKNMSATYSHLHFSIYVENK